MNRREKLEAAITEQRAKENMVLIPRDKLKAMQEKIKNLELETALLRKIIDQSGMMKHDTPTL